MFYKIMTKNPAMNGLLAEEKGRETLNGVEYIKVMFCLHGSKAFTYYQKT